MLPPVLDRGGQKRLLTDFLHPHKMHEDLKTRNWLKEYAAPSRRSFLLFVFLVLVAGREELCRLFGVGELEREEETDHLLSTTFRGKRDALCSTRRAEEAETGWLYSDPRRRRRQKQEQRLKFLNGNSKLGIIIKTWKRYYY